MRDMKVRNEYNCSDLFTALVKALETHGYPVRGLTAALAERWKRKPISVQRYRHGSKRLPVALVLDLAAILDALDVPCAIRLVRCREKVEGSPKKWLRKLKKETA